MGKTEQGTLILNDAQVNQKIRRMAYQIYENHVDEKKLILAGINGTGYSLASLLKKELDAIVPFEVQLVKVSIDKENPPESEIDLDTKASELDEQPVILVDDVQNTGKTFAYSMRPILNLKLKKLEVAVLVNRAHTVFPVSPNYTGYELSTTLNDHIKVTLEKNNRSVYLF